MKPPAIETSVDALNPLSEAVETGELLPSEILSSSASRFPQILEALAMERAASGDIEAAQGGFDLVFNAEGYDRISGFWTGSIIKTEARQNLR